MQAHHERIADEKLPLRDVDVVELDATSTGAVLLYLGTCETVNCPSVARNRSRNVGEQFVTVRCS